VCSSDLKLFGEFTLSLVGAHNVYNALCAIAITNSLGVGKEIIQVALAEFRGTERRLQPVGNINGAAVIDDYAHHPTEVESSLRAVREGHEGKKIWCVFQPHQVWRTRFFLKDFAKALSSADIIVVSEVYKVREQPGSQPFSARALADMLRNQGKPCLFFEKKEEISEFVRSKASDSFVIVTMGAGDIYSVAESLTK
jgi:UDP-N-acetylmuramate--alanine ligase